MDLNESWLKVNRPMMYLTLFFIYRLILKVGDDVVASPALEKKAEEMELSKSARFCNEAPGVKDDHISVADRK